MTNMEKKRLEKGLTQTELADRIGASPTLICGVEKKVKDMCGRLWKKAADVLECTTDELLKDILN